MHQRSSSTATQLSEPNFTLRASGPLDQRRGRERKKERKKEREQKTEGVKESYECQEEQGYLIGPFTEKGLLSALRGERKCHPLVPGDLPVLIRQQQLVEFLCLSAAVQIVGSLQVFLSLNTECDTEMGTAHAHHFCYDDVRPSSAFTVDVKLRINWE
ncbi:hypothetical protein JZ751_013537 [Albula glossodonta]|uniref:Uncharacterized protein n=1 Tax=Albula glossodonta TaxID=121402 RepID=A0A8T2MXK5_9TELE|nr:hypothetical protein JZ751_013537 [Albula glossodonta]